MDSNLKIFKKNISRIENDLKQKRIVILLGGFGEEREASIYTGEEVFKCLQKKEFTLKKVDPSEENIINKLIPTSDIVFNCLHGNFGESGHLSAILDYLKIPYTFSGIYASAVAMDKLYFSAIVSKLGMNSPKDNIDDCHLNTNEGVLSIFKKIRGGGSIGMKLENNLIIPPGYFVQEFINNGKIVTLGILESKGVYTPLGIVEVKLNNKKFYDQESKYLEGFSSYFKYSGRNENSIIKNSLSIFRFLSIKGAGRIDLVEKNNKLYILEINSVPGLYESSNLAYSASLKGLSFYQLLI